MISHEAHSRARLGSSSAYVVRYRFDNEATVVIVRALHSREQRED